MIPWLPWVPAAALALVPTIALPPAKVELVTLIPVLLRTSSAEDQSVVVASGWKLNFSPSSLRLLQPVICMVLNTGGLPLVCAAIVTPEAKDCPLIDTLP